MHVKRRCVGVAYTCSGWSEAWCVTPPFDAAAILPAGCFWAPFWTGPRGSLADCLLLVAFGRLLAGAAALTLGAGAWLDVVVSWCPAPFSGRRSSPAVAPSPTVETGAPAAAAREEPAPGRRPCLGCGGLNPKPWRAVPCGRWWSRSAAATAVLEDSVEDVVSFSLLQSKDLVASSIKRLELPRRLRHHDSQTDRRTNRQTVTVADTTRRARRPAPPLFYDWLNRWLVNVFLSHHPTINCLSQRYYFALSVCTVINIYKQYVSTHF